MSEAREDFVSWLHQLRVGQCVKIERETIERYFPVHPLFERYANTPREALLNRLVGSSWGAFRVQESLSGDYYTISRHEARERRVHVEADRRHLFSELADGTLEPITK